MPLNINVGLLGHVDSGKTSLAKSLSMISSTASFDKNPQSKERGITLDLGFSGLSVPLPDILNGKSDEGMLMFTFVDCPGHQSLIKTIIGGSQIIDLMILVLDVQKGFETQTGECLIIGEITEKPMIVVLNKIDLIDEVKYVTTIEKVTKKVKKTLESTIFKDLQIIPVSALRCTNIDVLKNAMIGEVKKMNLERKTSEPFIFAFDHCFAIKGSGTILSGTVLSGMIKVNDSIEIPSLKTERKVKSMQMFRKSVNVGNAGDRLGICITNFDPKQLERGLACQSNCVQPSFAVIIKLNLIRHFKRNIKSKEKFHCSIGHETVMGNILIFSSIQSDRFDWNQEYTYEPTVDNSSQNLFALIEFDHSVNVHNNILLIGSKLDVEQTNVCRLAFFGTILLENSSNDRAYQQTFLPNLKIFKKKTREGTVQRIVNDYELIANLFKKGTDRSKFFGMTCEISTGTICESGTICGSFGQSSKVRIQFPKPLHSSIQETVKNKAQVKVSLSFKKFIFDKNNRMVQ